MESPQHSQQKKLKEGTIYLLERKIIKIGNLAPSGHESCDVVSIDGIFPTFRENHGKGPYIAIKVFKEEKVC